MAVTLYITGNASPTGHQAACAPGETPEDNDLELDTTSPHAETTQTWNANNASGSDIGIAEFETVSGGMGETSWPSGTISCYFDVTTANSNCHVTGVYACRVNSSGVSQGTYGSWTGDRSMGTVQEEQFDLTCSSTSAATTDRIYFVVVGYKSSHGTASIVVGFATGWTTPFPETTTIVPTTATVDVTTSIPGIEITEHVTLTPATVTTTATGQVPVVEVTNNVTVVPGVSTITVTGGTSTITNGGGTTTVIPGSATVELTSPDPPTVATFTMIPDTGVVTLSSLPPTIVVTGAGSQVVTVGQWSKEVVFNPGDEWIVTVAGPSADAPKLRMTCSFDKPYERP